MHPYVEFIHGYLSFRSCTDCVFRFCSICIRKLINYVSYDWLFYRRSLLRNLQNLSYIEREIENICIWILYCQSIQKCMMYKRHILKAQRVTHIYTHMHQYSEFVRAILIPWYCTYMNGYHEHSGTKNPITWYNTIYIIGSLWSSLCLFPMRNNAS